MSYCTRASCKTQENVVGEKNVVGDSKNMKHVKTVFSTLFPIEKVLFIIVVRRSFSSKMVIPPKKKNFFSYFAKYCFF